MTTDTSVRALTDTVRDSMVSSRVLVFCKRGVLHMEWPRKEDGSRCISKNHLANDGKTVIDREWYRPIDTRGDSGAQGRGFMELSKDNPEDMRFLAVVKDWIENSGDPRVGKYGVRVEEIRTVAPPFGKWDDLKPKDALAALVATELGDDAAANRVKLEQAARYELSKSEPRQEILDGLDRIAAETGEESYDDGVIDESGAGA